MPGSSRTFTRCMRGFGVGGGSNVMGMFFDFLDEESVRLIGVEAGGRGTRSGEHAAKNCCKARPAFSKVITRIFYRTAMVISPTPIRYQPGWITAASARCWPGWPMPDVWNLPWLRMRKPWRPCKPWPAQKVSFRPSNRRTLLLMPSNWLRSCRARPSWPSTLPGGREGFVYNHAAFPGGEFDSIRKKFINHIMYKVH